MDDVLLPGRVPCSHCLSGCHGNALGHANELLRCGCLVGSILGLKQLEATKRNLTEILMKAESPP